jgi:hypothetical protein
VLLLLLLLLLLTVGGACSLRSSSFLRHCDYHHHHYHQLKVSQGRMKFVRPLYRELLEAPIAGAKELAVGTFAANKDAYHPICRKVCAWDTLD